MVRGWVGKAGGSKAGAGTHRAAQSKSESDADRPWIEIVLVGGGGKKCGAGRVW